MIRSISRFSFLLLYVAYLLGASTGRSFPGPIALAGLLILLTNIRQMSGGFKKPAWFFCAAGLSLLLLYRATPAIWISAFNSMLKTVAIIGIMQTLTITMHLGNYETAVTVYLSRYAKNESLFFLFMMLLSHCLGSILNLGCVVVLMASVGPELRNQMPHFPSLITKSITRGYCTAYLWAPGTVTVLIIIQLFDLSWRQYFLPAITWGIMGMVLAFLLEWPGFRRQPLVPAQNFDMTEAAMRQKMLQLLLVVAAIIFGILALEKLAFRDATGRLLLTACAVSLVWLLSHAGSPDFIAALRGYWDNTLDQNSDLAVFFISIGLFSTGVEISGATAAIQNFCNQHSLLFGRYLLFFLPLLIFGCSAVGLHPLVSMMMFGPIIANLPATASTIQLGLAMALGCSMSYAASPFAGLVLTMAKYTNASPRQISMIWNSRFALLYYVLGILYIYALPQ